MSTPRPIYVCRTCDRNAPPPAGEPSAGERLAARLQAVIAARTGRTRLEVRGVACLSGCLRPCNVSLRGTDRYTLRFSRVEPADLDAVVAVADDYWACADGALDEAQIPASLRVKLSVCTPPRGRWK